MEEGIILGKIIKVQGKAGEMICHFSIDKPEWFSDIKFIFIDIDQRLIPYHIESLELSDNYARISLEDVHNPELAQKLVSRDIYLPKKDFPELTEREFYNNEIIGFTIIDKEKGEIGRVKDVLERPEQSLLQIIHQNTEILIPLAEDLIIKVNKKQKQLIIDIPEGLLDLYL